jgi:hypothetical protein
LSDFESDGLIWAHGLTDSGMVRYVMSLSRDKWWNMTITWSSHMFIPRHCVITYTILTSCKKVHVHKFEIWMFASDHLTGKGSPVLSLYYRGSALIGWCTQTTVYVWGGMGAHLCVVLFFLSPHPHGLIKVPSLICIVLCTDFFSNHIGLFCSFWNLKLG